MLAEPDGTLANEMANSVNDQAIDHVVYPGVFSPGPSLGLGITNDNFTQNMAIFRCIRKRDTSLYLSKRKGQNYVFKAVFQVSS